MTSNDLITVLCVACAILGSLSVGAVVWAVARERALDRCWDYARARADTTTERGGAYSDMASVIALDGRVEGRPRGMADVAVSGERL